MRGALCCFVFFAVYALSFGAECSFFFHSLILAVAVGIAQDTIVVIVTVYHRIVPT